ncbi:MAG: hypothetical protein R3F18_03910 [Lysobacterales bacterium]
MLTIAVADRWRDGAMPKPVAAGIPRCLTGSGAVPTARKNRSLPRQYCRTAGFFPATLAANKVSGAPLAEGQMVSVATLLLKLIRLLLSRFSAEFGIYPQR